jgi:hypothetical protein
MLTCLQADAQRFLTEVFPSVQVTTNVKYGENISVFPPPTPAMIDLICDVYEPAGIPDPMPKRPLIIFMHTGSFLPPFINQTPTGSRNDSATVEICKRFARRGYVVANMDYRLGWNPQGTSLDIRRGTILQAIYRAIQDAKACVRFFRASAAGTNPFKIDPNLIILGGQGTGGYIAINYATLDKVSEIQLPKFISSTTEPAYGFVAGQPYVNQAILGDFDGYGGIPQFNNPNNSPGYPNEVQFVFNMGGAMGDSSFVEAGDEPMVSFHVIGDPFAPYGNGIVYVPGNPPQIVVEVSGSGAFQPIVHALGNNNCFINAGFTDVFTQQANTLNNGIDGLYPFATIPPVQAGPWEWFDSLATIAGAAQYGIPAAQAAQIYSNALLTNPDMSKAKAMAYIDTIMGYLNPRIVYCLNLPTGMMENQAPDPAIRIFPSLLSKDEILTIESNHPIQRIEMSDATGKTVLLFQKLNRHAYQIQSKTLASGVYLVKVVAGDQLAVKKIAVRD